MSNRELTALGIRLPVRATDVKISGSMTETTIVDTNIENATMPATTATQFNPYRGDIELL